MNEIFYVQDIIISLQNFWLKKGCLLLPSYDQKKGAGTLNLHALLIALEGKKDILIPLEKCSRSNDGLFLKKGCRLNTHHQMEVILNSPTNFGVKDFLQESLEIIGINDFVLLEDNWEHNLICAKGIGWEVRSADLEICQVTYFFELGQIILKNRPLEFAFGIERLAMLKQNVDSVYELMWDKNTKYSSLFYFIEEDHSYTYQEELIDLEKRISYMKNYLDEKLYFLSLEELIYCSEIFNRLARKEIDTVLREYMLKLQMFSKNIFENLKTKCNF